MANKKIKSLTRKQLYNKVWQKPMTKLAPEFGLSDVGLAKICRRYDIPLPPVGYWAMLAHGKEVERPSLPDLDDESLTDVISFRETREKVELTDKRAKLLVNVSDKIAKPHSHVKSTPQALNLAKSDENGILYSKDKNCLSINVSKQLVPRSLRIFDAIIKAWEKEGGEINLLPSDALGRYIVTKNDSVLAATPNINDSLESCSDLKMIDL